jgi:hypothetical protein
LLNDKTGTKFVVFPPFYIQKLFIADSFTGRCVKGVRNLLLSQNSGKEIISLEQFKALPSDLHREVVKILIRRNEWILKDDSSLTALENDSSR